MLEINIVFTGIYNFFKLLFLNSNTILQNKTALFYPTMNLRFMV